MTKEEEEMEEPHDAVMSASNENTVALSDIIRKTESPLVLEGKAAVERAPPGRELLLTSPYCYKGQCLF